METIRCQNYLSKEMPLSKSQYDHWLKFQQNLGIMASLMTNVLLQHQEKWQICASRNQAFIFASTRARELTPQASPLDHNLIFYSRNAESNVTKQFFPRGKNCYDVFNLFVFYFLNEFLRNHKPFGMTSTGAYLLQCL